VCVCVITSHVVSPVYMHGKGGMLSRRDGDVELRLEYYWGGTSITVNLAHCTFKYALYFS